MAISEQKSLRRESPRRARSRIAIAVALALAAAGASAWFMAGREVRCDSLAPLTVLATLAAFLISVCFRMMGRYADKRSRWILLGCVVIAGATLFADFRFVRRYREFCDQLQQQGVGVQAAGGRGAGEQRRLRAAGNSVAVTGVRGGWGTAFTTEDTEDAEGLGYPTLSQGRRQRWGTRGQSLRAGEIYGRWF